jgi:TPR repeat protein
MQNINFSKSFIELAALISLLACTLPATANDSADEAAPSASEAAAMPIDPATAQADAAKYKSSLVNHGAILIPTSLKLNNAVGTLAYYQEAFDLHCSAARTGDANGYYVMGWLYANGRGVRRDLFMASTLMGKAAELGHVKAKEILEVMPRPAAAPEMPACLTAPPAEPEMTASEEPVEFYKRHGKVYELVSRLAPEYGIDIDLAMAVIAVESGFNPRVTSPKNAQGLMQLIPDTASRFRVRDAYDPEQNVKGGLAYLRWLMDQFEGNIELVAAAYNAGEKAVEKYGGIPPYPETRNYVQKIRTLYRKNTHPYRDRMGRIIGHTSP